MASKKASNKDDAAEAAAEVGRIRDIIFGNEMRDYDRRFDSLQAELDRIQHEIDRLRSQAADSESSINARVKSERDEARKSDDALRSELRETAAELKSEKVGRAELAEMLEAIAGAIRDGANGDSESLLTRLLDAKNGADSDR